MTQVQLFLLADSLGQHGLCRFVTTFGCTFFPGRVVPGADAFGLNPLEILFCQVYNALNLEIQGTGFWKGHLNWTVDGFLFCIKETQGFTLCW